MSDFVYNGDVDIADTDAGGVIYFANYFRWVERAEKAWFRSLGFEPFVRHEDGSFTGFPRVNVSCDYRSPIYPGDTFAVALTVQKSGRASFSYAFRIFRGTVEGKLAAEGSATIVCARGNCGGGFKVRELPPELSGLKS